MSTVAPWRRTGTRPATAARGRLDVAQVFVRTEAAGVGLEAGMVDNRSDTIDEAYQGLQFVYRLRDRPPPGR